MEKSVALEELIEHIEKLENERTLLIEQRATYDDLHDEAKRIIVKFSGNALENYVANMKQVFRLDLKSYVTTQKMSRTIH